MNRPALKAPPPLLLPRAPELPPARLANAPRFKVERNLPPAPPLPGLPDGTAFSPRAVTSLPHRRGARFSTKSSENRMTLLSSVVPQNGFPARDMSLFQSADRKLTDPSDRPSRPSPAGPPSPPRSTKRGAPVPS